MPTLMSFSKRIYNHELVCKSNFMTVFDGGDRSLQCQQRGKSADRLRYYSQLLLAVAEPEVLVPNTLPWVNSEGHSALGSEKQHPKTCHVRYRTIIQRFLPPRITNEPFDQYGTSRLTFSCLFSAVSVLVFARSCRQQQQQLEVGVSAIVCCMPKRLFSVVQDAATDQYSQINCSQQQSVCAK